MKTIFAVTIALSLGAIVATSTEAQLLNTSNKKQTSDPYFSTPAQTAAEPNSNTKARQNARTSDQTEIWKSLSRKTKKPVQRVDFSQLQVNPAVKADLVKTASAWQAPKTKSTRATTQPNRGNSVTIDFAAQATSRTTSQVNSQATHQAHLKGQRKPLDPFKPATGTGTGGQTFSSLVPLQVAKIKPKQTAANPTSAPDTSAGGARKSKLLSPLPKSIALSKQPKQLGSTPIAKPLKPAAQSTSDFQTSESAVKQATYQEPLGGSFVPGQNIKKIRSKIKQLSAPSNVQSNTQSQFDGGYRVADSSNAFNSYQGQTLPGETIIVDPPTAFSSQAVTGESFEPSRVVAIVGGEPIFVGDMLFEVNQLLEKYMKGAPEAAKVQQRGNLIKRLLPKYVDQKMLFISTTNQLPDGADIEDIITQAEKTFNEKALPDMMKKSGITSTAQFDGNLRAQGSSIRQMRRSWAKDQVSRFLLADRVQVSQDVTHRELLDEYRDTYDSYAHTAKCRWEKIEIKFSKAGGRFPAKDKMDEIYQRLVHGGNFQAVARKESHGFKASKGGQHDWTNRGSLVSKKVDEAIFTLPQGRLSEIIETKDSFLVVRVVERIDAHHTPFEEAQAEIKEKIVEARQNKEFKKYLAKIRKEIPVEYPEG